MSRPPPWLFAQLTAAGAVQITMRGSHFLCLLVLTLALGCDAGEKTPPAESARMTEANRAKEAEIQERLEAERAAARIQSLAYDLDRFEQDISRAVSMVADARTPTEREAAKTRLRELQQEQAELKRRITEARALAETNRRTPKVTLECANNPLAQGCP